MFFLYYRNSLVLYAVMVLDMEIKGDDSQLVIQNYVEINIRGGNASESILCHIFDLMKHHGEVRITMDGSSIKIIGKDL